MLVSCVAYQDGRKLGDIPKESISEYVKRTDAFVWVALKDPERAELDEMAAEFGLHPLAVEDARHGRERPKIEEYGNSLFAVLHVIELREGEVRVGEIDIFVGPNYILSVRQRTEHGFGEVRVRAESEPELLKNGAGFVLYTLMDNIVDRYFPVVDALEIELEAIAERIFTEGSAKMDIKALYDLKHKGMAVRHAVEPLIEATHKLYGGRRPAGSGGTPDTFLA